MTRDTREQAKARDEAYRSRTADHVARYLASDGANGFDDNRHMAPTLLLTTVGRRSGRKIVTPLYFGERDGMIVIIGSYAGSDTHPKWYLNLQDRPDVQVQVKADKYAATARTADVEEKAALWPIMSNAYPFYNNYVQATERNIPLVILERKVSRQ
jgi:deazaflavin-dependent oxidoreductase (nitroreductase family)